MDNLRSYYNVNRNLLKKNAFGLIVANPENAQQFETMKKTLKDHTLGKRTSLPGIDTTKSELSLYLDTIKFINTIIIPNSGIKSIMGYSGKELTKLANDGNINDAKTTRIKLKFEMREDSLSVSNVVGVAQGRTRESIVVSAHYDHLGKSDKNGHYFAGADDNASGVAALLELAEKFSQRSDLHYNIIFVATSAEEERLLGSLYHVNTPTFNADNVICNINLDMIGRTDDKHRNGKYLYCIGTGQHAALDQIIAKADSAYTSCTLDYSMNSGDLNAGIFTRSDNYNFYRKGIPSFHFFSGFHADYHRESDTADKIDFKNLQNRVALVGEVITLIQNRYKAIATDDSR